MSNMDNMSNELEKFIKDNREEFDEVHPPAGLWNKIEDQIQPQKKAVVVKIGWIKMAAAAAVIAAVGLLTLKIINTGTGKPIQTETVKNTEQPKSNDTAVTQQPETAQQQSVENIETPPQQNNNLASNNIRKNETTQADDEMGALVHFAKIIHNKQKQLLPIKQYSPELYEHFVSDYKKLDASYNQLKEEMNTNPNKEVLLEKMITNLQLQIDLLNEQLKVVRQLKNYKKDKANEISKSM